MKKAQEISFAEDDTLDYLEYILYKNNAYSCVKIVENAKTYSKNKHLITIKFFYTFNFITILSFLFSHSLLHYIYFNFTT